MKKAVIFIDGSNFYNQLQRLEISIYTIKRWNDFFKKITEKHDLLRIYWYQIAHIQDKTISIETVKSYLFEKRITLKELSQHWSAKEKKSIVFQKEGDLVTKATEWLKNKNNELAQQHRKFDRIIDSCNCLEFKRVGVLKVDPYMGESISSKGDDVAMAVDIVSLCPYYDTAYIISGDFDFSPAIQKAKDQLKEVISVQFNDKNNKAIGVSILFQRIADQVICFNKEDISAYQK